MSSEELKLEHYVIATIDAGKRVRKIVFIFSLSGILSFMAFWNSREESWPESRRDLVVRILECLNTPKHCDLTKEQIDLYGTNVDVLKNYLENFKFITREAYLVRLPILGIAFDINDLGIFSGLTFSFLLLLFWFALEREEENLKITFDLAKKQDCVKDVYTYLSMGQVLTLPERVGLKRAPFWKYLSKLVFLTPLIVYFIVFINDVITCEVGFLLNWSATLILVISSSIFLFIISSLTVLTQIISLRLDGLWKEIFEHEFSKESLASDSRMKKE